MMQSAKLIGAGSATISLAGSGVGIGVVFASLIGSIARNPALLKQLFVYAILFLFLSEHNLLSAKAEKPTQQNKVLYDGKNNAVFWASSFLIVGSETGEIVGSTNQQGEHVLSNLPAIGLTASLDFYSTLYEDLSPTKMATILVGTVVLAVVLFSVAQRMLPIENLELREATSFFLAVLFAASNIHFLLSKIPLYDDFTMYNGFICLIIVYVVSGGVLSPSFRQKIVRIVTQLFGNFVEAIENTVDLHFGIKPAYIRDCLIFLYYFIIGTSVAACTAAHYWYPWLIAKVWIFYIIFAFVRYWITKKLKPDYTFKSFIASFFYGAFVIVQFIVVGTNLIVLAPILFFSTVLLGYLDGYGSRIEKMKRYIKEYTAASAKINEGTAFFRMSIRALHWGIIISPMYFSNYFYILSYGFAYAMLYKLSKHAAAPEGGHYRGFPFEDNLAFVDTASLYTGLYCCLFSLMFNIAIQNWFWRFGKKENTAIYALINLTSHDAVCDIVGNTPGKAVIQKMGSNGAKMVVVAVGAVGVTVVEAAGAKVQLDMDIECAGKRSDEAIKRIAIAQTNSPTGVISDEQQQQIWANVREEIRTPQIWGRAASFFGIGQDFDHQMSRPNQTFSHSQTLNQQEVGKNTFKPDSIKDFSKFKTK